MSWAFFEGWGLRNNKKTGETVPTVEILKSEIDQLREKIVTIQYKASRASKNYLNVDQNLKDEIEIKMAILEENSKKLFEIANP